MTNQPQPTSVPIVAMAQARKRRRLVYKVVAALLVLAGVAVFFGLRAQQTGKQGTSYVTKNVKLGELRETVTATGTLKGLDSVDVGAQISGRVARVLVDFNDRVRAGQPLAEIDPEQLKSRVEQARAQVRAADAAVRLARATLTQSAAERDRTRDLAQKGLASSRDLETAEANAARATASIASAEAQATLARASLRDSETSLSYSIIKAPMDGIILARLVEPGQTVAASLQSPVLFTLARDLSQLRLYVDVDEADVGRVLVDQPATFGVDAWPSRVFNSKVVSVHNLPTAGQTVVTYQAVLSVVNDDLSLRPGMTATATIITAEQKGVLVVPNAALRFSPPAAVARAAPQSGTQLFGVPAPRVRGSAQRAPGAPEGAGTSAIYLLQDGQPKRVAIKIGGTDGEWTSVLSGPLKAGQPVIVDVEQRGPK